MMKKALFILLTGFLCSFSGDDESGDWSRDFLYYEPNLNLMYISVDEKLIVQDGKKQFQATVTNNLAVYDVNTDSTRYIFTKGMEECIEEVLYEEKFDAETGSIIFNTDADDEESSVGVNNTGLAQRPLSSKMIIQTRSIRSDISSIWMCNKNGTGLEKLDDVWDNYLLDAKGRNVLIIKKFNSRIEVKKVKY